MAARRARTGPGEQIAVSVKGDRKVKVSVLRVSASGKVMSSVVRRTLKRGSVTATLARAGTYAVRVDRRERHAEGRRGAAARAPRPPRRNSTACREHACSSRRRLSADRVQRGQTLPYSIRNTSDGCVTTGAGYQLEYQRATAQWKPAPWPLIFPIDAVICRRAGSTPTASTSRRTRRSASTGSSRLGGFTEPTFEVVA